MEEEEKENNNKNKNDEKKKNNKKKEEETRSLDKSIGSCLLLNESCSSLATSVRITSLLLVTLS